MNAKRFLPSPAMIVAIVALVLALGGTSYAAIVLPAGSVGTKQLRTNAVTGAKVKNGSLTASDISWASMSKVGRVAMGYGSASFAPGQIGRVATVDITAPQAGFVIVNGTIDAAGQNSTWGVRVWDDTGDAHCPWYNGGAPSGEVSATNIGVFRVPAGARQFSVRFDFNDSTTVVDCWGTITAQYVPFGANGSATSLGVTRGQLTPQRMR